MSTGFTMRPRSWPQRVLAFLIVAFLVVAGFQAVRWLWEATTPDTATVLRVVDGDTLDVRYGGHEQRLHLLNIDAPERPGAKRLTQCLGTEAASWLGARLPAGTRIVLEFDGPQQNEEEDLLAGVHHNDSLINAEVARYGYGVPTLATPNDRFFGSVDEAWQEAKMGRVGLMDPHIDCTVPAQVEEYEHKVDAIVTNPGTSMAATELLAITNDAVTEGEILGASLDAENVSASSNAVLGNPHAKVNLRSYDNRVSDTLRSAVIKRSDLTIVKGRLERHELNAPQHAPTGTGISSSGTGISPTGTGSSVQPAAPTDTNAGHTGTGQHPSARSHGDSVQPANPGGAQQAPEIAVPHSRTSFPHEVHPRAPQGDTSRAPRVPAAPEDRWQPRDSANPGALAQPGPTAMPHHPSRPHPSVESEPSAKPNPSKQPRMPVRPVQPADPGGPIRRLDPGTSSGPPPGKIPKRPTQSPTTPPPAHEGALPSSGSRTRTDDSPTRTPESGTVPDGTETSPTERPLQVGEYNSWGGVALGPGARCVCGSEIQKRAV